MTKQRAHLSGVAWLLSLLVLGLVAACGSAQPQAAPPAAPAAPAISAPTAVHIPAIGADSTLIPTGLNPDGSVATPPDTEPMQASWFDRWHRPGEIGPAVILGHVDGRIDGKKGQPGIFYRLHDLKPGDAITVDRADGSTVAFVVTAVEKHPKSAFPHDRVYGPTDLPTLRLVTCGGAFDHAEGSYVDNWVVFATQAGVLP